MNINLTVAKNIKQIREQKKLTLDAAAAISGVSRSMLAQMEKGDVNPTISVLWKVANGYKVSFTSLMEPDNNPTMLVPLEAISPIVEANGKFTNYPVFSFDEQRLFETYRIVIAPKGILCSDAHLAGTEEYITVFNGIIEIRINNEVFHLKEGDSIRFKSNTAHSYKNIGTEQASLSMLIYYEK